MVHWIINQHPALCMFIKEFLIISFTVIFMTCKLTSEFSSFWCHTTYYILTYCILHTTLHVCVCVLSRSCLTLQLMDYSPPGSSVHEILQARILEWVDIPFSRETSAPRDQTQVSCIFTDWATREAHFAPEVALMHQIHTSGSLNLTIVPSEPVVQGVCSD